MSFCCSKRMKFTTVMSAAIICQWLLESIVDVLFYMFYSCYFYRFYLLNIQLCSCKNYNKTLYPYSLYLLCGWHMDAHIDEWRSHLVWPSLLSMANNCPSPVPMSWHPSPACFSYTWVVQFRESCSNNIFVFWQCVNFLMV